MLYKSLFQLYPDNFQNDYFLLSDKLEDKYSNLRYNLLRFYVRSMIIHIWVI